MTILRRAFLFGFASFGVGAAAMMATDFALNASAKERTVTPPQPRYFDDTGVRDWVLTDGDFDVLATQDGLPRSSTLSLMDNADIPGGGDFREARMSNVTECVTACEEDEACNAFTYARLSHPRADKRNMCWLKSEGDAERAVDSIHYISGVRN